MNDGGEVLALMQQPTASNAPTPQAAYAVSARFADSLRITGLSINDQVLKATSIKKALPDDISQAQLTLFVAAAQMDSTAYAALINDFIAQFPSSHEGYIYRAEQAAKGLNFEQADRDMAQALKVSANPDEVHYSLSRMIYQKELYYPNVAYDGWNFDRAFTEAQAAYAASPQPTYRHQQAMVLFAQRRYDDAYNIYEELFTSPIRSADIFYEASRCKKMAGDTVAHLALLDSCVSTFSKPYLKEAAPYLLASAQARMEVGKNREAAGLLNEYEQLMAAQVNDKFYYLRFQAEVDGRLFQQALNDISKAIEITESNIKLQDATNSNLDFYYAEKASLQVRVGLYDDAIETAKACIDTAPNQSNGYLFLGLAQCLKGQKAEGLKNLEKAREMGDPQATELIEKYSK